MRRIFLGRRVMAALSFLTIFLPMVKEGVKNEELGSSMAFFPVVALLAGVLL